MKLLYLSVSIISIVTGAFMIAPALGVIVFGVVLFIAYIAEVFDKPRP